MIELTRRNLGKAALVSGLAAAARAVPGLAASPPGVSDEELLASVNPELREYARPMLAWRSGPPLPQTYRDIRKQAASPPQPRPGIPVTRQVIPVPAGVPAVTVYVINAGGTDRPAILHTHGGGFVMGNAGSEVPAKQAMARDLDCVIVTVDYALAPEATYAISTEQTHAALKWLHVNARELGVDRERIALLGESAGGGHAALLALAARDRGEVPVAFQCLVYPMLDDRTGSSRMPPPPIGQLAWDAPANRFGWHSFLGQTPGYAECPRRRRSSARGDPARAASGVHRRRFDRLVRGRGHCLRPAPDRRRRAHRANDRAWRLSRLRRGGRRDLDCTAVHSRKDGRPAPRVRPDSRLKRAPSAISVAAPPWWWRTWPTAPARRPPAAPSPPSRGTRRA
jgi:acetyl esterase/lipase